MDKSILLVEDNSDDEALILRAIRQHAPRNVIVARDGVEALDVLFRSGSDETVDRLSLILLDLTLPRVGGMEVLRRIKEDAGTEAIPVVLFSSSTAGQDIPGSYQLTAHNYLRKLVDYKSYCNEVSRVMSYWLDATSKETVRNIPGQIPPSSPPLRNAPVHLPHFSCHRL